MNRKREIEELMMEKIKIVNAKKNTVKESQQKITKKNKRVPKPDPPGPKQ